MECPQCGGNNTEIIAQHKDIIKGVLKTIITYRCRACGKVWTKVT